MSWLVSLRDSLRNRLGAVRDLLAQMDRRGARIRYESVDDLPDRLQPSTLYVAGDESHPWAAALLCPCGCGDTIALNLMKKANPCWKIRLHADGIVSVTPSIWRTKGCRSHFVLHYGRIKWYGARPGAARQRA